MNILCQYSIEGAVFQFTKIDLKRFDLGCALFYLASNKYKVLNHLLKFEDKIKKKKRGERTENLFNNFKLRKCIFENILNSGNFVTFL